MLVSPADGLDANGNASSITSSRKEGAPGLAQQTGQPEPISSSSKVGVSVTVMALALHPISPLELSQDT